jgi:hypothetical protein
MGGSRLEDRRIVHSTEPKSAKVAILAFMKRACLHGLFADRIHALAVMVNPKQGRSAQLIMKKIAIYVIQATIQ